MLERNKTTDMIGASVRSKREDTHSSGVKGIWEVKAFDKDGNLKWVENYENIVVNTGLDHLLDATLSGGTQITTWYVGLTDGTPTAAAGDTSASHAGWSEVTAYSEGARQTWVDGGVSSRTVTNSGSPAEFSINSNSTTIGGAFLISNSTKGGTSGTLYAIGAFSAGDKSLDNGDTLQVTATFTTAAA